MILEKIIKQYKPKEQYKPTPKEFKELMYCNTMCYDERYE